MKLPQEIHAMRAVGTASGMRCNDPKDALIIAGYELGATLRAMFRASFYPAGSDERRGLLSHAETEVADLLMQLRIAFLLMGRDIDLFKLMAMGEEKWGETMMDLRHGRRKD